MSKKSYVCGLDIGPAQDFTALAIVEMSRKRINETSGRTHKVYAVRHLERFPPGTPYADMITRLGEMFSDKLLRGSPLVIDQTAVGKPVIELIKAARIRCSRLRAVTITAGQAATYEPKVGWLVPRKELVSLLQILLQARRLKVAGSLPEAHLLTEELTTFRTKVISVSEDTEALWREGQHDDLVLAVALAVWEAERMNDMPSAEPIVLGRRRDPFGLW